MRNITVGLGGFRAVRAAAGISALLIVAFAPVGHAQMGVKVDIVSRFDHEGKGWLDAKERTEARQALDGDTFGRRGWGGWGASGAFAPVTPGTKLTPAMVPRYGQQPLFDLPTLRTIFITFEDKDWEQELADFYRTDVDVPATIIVDGQTYNDVGVHFRGMTSFRMIDTGHKRSMDLNFDFLHHKQKLLGYHKLQLLNAAADPTFLRNALYMRIMSDYTPAPKVNYVRVVINGENWGIYVNQEHLTGEFTQDAVGFEKSMRWKVLGNPRARGGLEYLGDDPAPYRRIYEIKSEDTPQAWTALIHLCKVLNTTPPAQLQAALAPLLDVDGALRFLAVDKALINNDGFWVRSSDYSIYTDSKGRFHVTAQDANETLRPTEDENFGRFGGGDDAYQPNSVTLAPLAGASDPTKALLYRLLLVPALRERYLGYVRDVAQRWLDWNRLGPLAQRYQAVIADGIKADTHKLYSTDSFAGAVVRDNTVPDDGSPIAVPGMSLKNFAEQRRAYLLAVTGPHSKKDSS